MLSQVSKRIRTHRVIKYRSVFTDVHISNEVREALSKNIPVVALESTIISHGMPFPMNLEVAKSLEESIRKEGAIPATIAIINGFPKVGLVSSDFNLLANPDSRSSVILKASRRDIAYACANRLNAATTVASTMIFAKLAGIRVFATGGIGGVHRGAESTMDISADLDELSRTNVAVVSSGIKSILDIHRTLEVLETKGVPVYGYQSSEFPAFFTNNSGIKSPLVAAGALDIARAMACQDDLGLNQGMLVAVPNPDPGQTAAIQDAINIAIQEAISQKIEGALVTPFVLRRVNDLTGGDSLKANIALVMNNAVVAARIAREYAPLAAAYSRANSQIKFSGFCVSEVPSISRNNANDSNDSTHQNAKVEEISVAIKDTNISATSKVQPSELDGNEGKPHVIVIGGAVVDQMMMPYRTDDKLHPLIMKSSNPGKIATSYGGVGRNIAEALGRLRYCKVSLISAVGNDPNGDGLVRHAALAGVDTSHILRGHKDSSQKTAVYAAVHDHKGDLVVAIADMNIFHDVLTPVTLTSTLNDIIQKAMLVVCDGNISPDSFSTVANMCYAQSIPLFFEPTSSVKCQVPIDAKALYKIDIIKPNVSELVSILRACLDRNMISNGRTYLKEVIERYDAISHEADSIPDVKQYLRDIRIMGSALLSYMIHTDSHVKSPSPASNRVRGKHVLVSMGKLGIMWFGPKEMIGKQADVYFDNFISCKLIPPTQTSNPLKIVNTSGAGDSFCAGVIHGLMPGVGHGPNIDAIYMGLRYAAHSLQSKTTIPTEVDVSWIESR